MTLIFDILVLVKPLLAVDINFHFPHFPQVQSANSLLESKTLLLTLKRRCVCFILPHSLSQCTLEYDLVIHDDLSRGQRLGLLPSVFLELTCLAFLCVNCFILFSF